MPLEVQFTDLSCGPVVVREWDLVGDDVVDSTNRDPSFIYTSPGTYTVSLTVINGANADTEIREAYIHVFALDTPEISDIQVISDEIILSWSPVSGAVSYNVYSSHVTPYQDETPGNDA